MTGCASILPRTEGVVDRARCLSDGVRACSPEDVGGIGGYAGFLKAMADPGHPEHEEYRTWVVGDFDPDHFDLTAAQRRVKVSGRNTLAPRWSTSAGVTPAPGGLAFDARDTAAVVEHEPAARDLALRRDVETLLAHLRALSVGEPVRLEPFVDSLIAEVGWTWSQDASFDVRAALGSVIEAILIRPMARFGVLALTRPRPRRSLAAMGESLRGVSVVVTGAGRGIGRAIAIGLGREGASVCCAARTLSDVEATARAVQEAGGRGLAVAADVTLPQDVQELFARAARELGGVDVLFVNAGGSFETAPVETGEPANWRQTIELNLFGAYYCMREAIPHLKRSGGGKIITLGSGLGHRGRPGTSAYSCAKAGLWMLTRVLAQEVVEAGISVNELIPGPVLTERNLADAARGGGVFGIPGEWVKQPEDVVALAVFLASQPRVGPTAQSYSLMRREG